MENFMTPTQLQLAAAEEARHAGLLWCYGIPVQSAIAREDGSGLTTFTMITKTELAALFQADVSAALDVTLSYVAAGLVGCAHGEAPSEQDAALVEHCASLWQALTGASRGNLLIRGELRATQFVLGQQAGIQRFSRILATRGYLAGSELQERLAQCFARERQPVRLGDALKAWIAAEKQAVQKREWAKQADSLAAYWEAWVHHP
jgi:hypothetical protein